MKQERGVEMSSHILEIGIKFNLNERSIITIIQVY